MTDLVQTQEKQLENRSDRRGPTLFVWLGPPVVFAGAVSYFVYFAHFPSLRDFPWVNLPLVALGLVISARGLQRVFMDATNGLLARVFASVAFFLSLAITALFSAYIFYLSYQLPETAGVVQVGQSAADFALPNQHGQTIELNGLRGRKVVLAFYRGHW